MDPSCEVVRIGQIREIVKRCLEAAISQAEFGETAQVEPDASVTN